MNGQGILPMLNDGKDSGFVMQRLLTTSYEPQIGTVPGLAGWLDNPNRLADNLSHPCRAIEELSELFVMTNTPANRRN
jgi:hypothetical protein